MAGRNKNEQAIYDMIVGPIEAKGIDLIDVKFEREGKALFLRVYVDKRGGITIDECAEINELIDPMIDENFPYANHDYFEVSSPGLLRPLTEAADFNRYAGETVEIKTYRKIDERKAFSGELLGGDDNTVSIREENGEERTFALSDCAKITRAIEF